MKVTLVGLGLALLLLFGLGIARYNQERHSPARNGSVPGGELRIKGADGRSPGVCPLQHTDVRADITGIVGRVRVRQTFQNPLDRKIEAVYVFPLPQDAAVDEMVMVVGERRIVGWIKPKEQARKTYERAKAAGHVTSLLDQERPNVFTQSVANIEPGVQVQVEISYVETLQGEDGVFEWVFPTVVGPRYMPGYPAGRSGTGEAPDTTRVPDASRISPPVAPPSQRAGHDLSLTVHLDAGMRLSDIDSELHAVDVQRPGADQAVVTLQRRREIPNRDFILRYRAATDEVQDALFSHRDDRGGFFTLLLQPPRREAVQARPREMIFVIDRSGSMEGFPLEKARETMQQCIEGMNPRNTFNLISFSESVDSLFPRPQPNTPSSRAEAQKYLAGLAGSGGTEMLPAIQAALERPADPERLRIVCFMSDGYVGNDLEIIDTVRKHAGRSRLFAFGIGDSVNRFLIDRMAHAGRGEVEYVTQEKAGSAAARRFHERIQAPVLTDIQIDWGGLRVSEVYPRQLPDLFSHKPITLHGRLAGEASGTVTLSGRTARGPFERKVALRPAEAGARRDALASLWARAKIKELMMQDMAGLQNGQMREDLKQQITDLGVRYRLMTQFTSFVAVEERIITRGGPPALAAVPVNAPRGVSGKLAAGAGGTLLAQARAGDPLIRVQAPADAVQVVALLPGGDVKRLRFNRDSGQWEARFDIPTYVPEGDYFVTVVLVTRDGARRVLTLRYRVDSTPPGGAGRVRPAPGAAGRSVRLDLEASEDTVRVVALLPWGERVALRRAAAPGHQFAGTAPLPADREEAGAVTFVLTDRAHNRTVVTVDMSD